MKIIIAGGRNLTDYEIVKSAVREAAASKKWNICEIVSGHASGVDLLGEKYASETGIATRTFPADWKRFGRGAGPVRNRQMADYADGLIAIWDGKSKGTKNMIETMKINGKPCHVFITN